MQQPGQVGTPVRDQVLEFDRDAFRTHYNRAAFGFRHRWQLHPMLSTTALLALAKRLKPDQVHLHRAETRIDEDFYNAARAHPVEYTLEGAMQDIAASNSYVMLRNPHTDPEYGEFLRPLWEEVGLQVDPIDPGRCDHMSFVFVSPPRAITPFHIDRVTTFHLQIQGEKTIHLWDPFDRVVVSDEDLSHVVAEPATYHAPYKPEFQSRAQSFLQKPGLGVHHPWVAPHAVEVGSEVSVSLAITFRSKDMKRRGDLYEFNHALRRRGLHPQPIGQSKWRDALKLLAFRGYGAVKGAKPNTQEDEH